MCIKKINMNKQPRKCYYNLQPQQIDLDKNDETNRRKRAESQGIVG